MLKKKWNLLFPVEQLSPRLILDTAVAMVKLHFLEYTVYSELIAQMKTCESTKGRSSVDPNRA